MGLTERKWVVGATVESLECRGTLCGWKKALLEAIQLLNENLRGSQTTRAVASAVDSLLQLDTKTLAARDTWAVSSGKGEIKLGLSWRLSH